MTFEHDGKRYRISFERRYRHVNFIRKGATHSIRSKYPYTTAVLQQLRIGEPGQVVARGTVGCLPIDKYSKAAGALFAMRELTRAIGKSNQTKELRTAVWATYKNRKEQPEKLSQTEPIKAAVTSAPIVLKALPPSSLAEALNLDQRVIH